jgi:hypothetical protein
VHAEIQESVPSGVGEEKEEEEGRNEFIDRHPQQNITQLPLRRCHGLVLLIIVLLIT